MEMIFIHLRLYNIRTCLYFDINCEIMSTKWNEHEVIEYEYKYK